MARAALLLRLRQHFYCHTALPWGLGVELPGLHREVAVGALDLQREKGLSKPSTASPAPSSVRLLGVNSDVKPRLADEE